MLASLGMFVGNLWILAKADFAKAPSFPSVAVGEVGEIPVRGVKLFAYRLRGAGSLHPDPHRPRGIRGLQPKMHTPSVRRILLLEDDRLECPCHQGFFSVRDGWLARSSTASTPADHSRKGWCKTPCRRRKEKLIWPISNVPSSDADSWQSMVQ